MFDLAPYMLHLSVGKHENKMQTPIHIWWKKSAKANKQTFKSLNIEGYHTDGLTSYDKVFFPVCVQYLILKIFPVLVHHRNNTVRL